MQRILVIGGGHAGGQFLDASRKLGFEGDLLLVSDEPVLPYQRPPLSKKYLAGEMSPERIAFRPPAAFEKLNVEARLGQRATAIDRAKRQVTLGDGSTVDYDALALVTGARVRRLALPHEHLTGVHYLRTLADVDGIRAELEEVRNVVIIGGGFIGLEAAAVLAGLGKEVTVLEMAERVMARAVAPVISHFFEGIHNQAGVRIQLAAGVNAIHGRQRVTQVTCTDDSSYPADLVLVGIGVLPNTELAEAAGLACEDGILVDEFAATSDPAIVAAGDCTRHPNPLLGGMLRLESVHNALEQAKTAAATVLGRPSAYRQIPWFWSDQYQYKLQMAGLSEGFDRHLVQGDMDAGTFVVSYFRKGRLIAVDTVNRGADHMAARKILNAGQEVREEDARETGFSLVDLARSL